MKVMNNVRYDDVLVALERTLNDGLEADEVPVCNPKQCGWAASHSFEGAKKIP